jgi:hypothetical protein
MLEANLDFSYGCITGFVPGENASFCGDVFQGFYRDKLAECNYCYALDKHKTYPKTFVKIDKKKLYDELLHGNFEDFNNNKVGKKVNILRLGKRTEAGAVYNRTQLVETLETCIDAKTKVILPTKFLEYDPELSKLLKASHTQVLYSIGFDDLESGAYAHFRNNAWRVEQAKLYEYNGVDASIYPMLDLTSEIGYMDRLLISDALAQGLSVQLLGARIPNKDLAVRITGRTWENLKQHHTQQTITGEARGGYVLTGNTSLTPEIMHPDILKMVGNNNGNIRLCHHNSRTTWCGACFACDGFIKDTVDPKLKSIRKYKKKYKEKTGKLDLKFD